MPGRSGMELIRRVKTERPALRVLVLSMHEELQYAVRAIKSGASGYLTKESAPGQLVEAIRKIAAGGAFISAQVAEQLALGAMPGAVQSAPHEVLTEREFEVFRQLVAGLSVTEVATRLNVSAKTVSTHKANLMQKLEVKSLAEALRIAFHAAAEKDEA